MREKFGRPSWVGGGVSLGFDVAIVVSMMPIILYAIPGCRHSRKRRAYSGGQLELVLLSTVVLPNSRPDTSSRARHDMAMTTCTTDSVTVEIWELHSTDCWVCQAASVWLRRRDLPRAVNPRTRRWESWRRSETIRVLQVMIFGL